MDTWLVTYTTISLGCNFSILDALFYNFPAKNALDIWKQLERRQVNGHTADPRDLESILRQILTDNNWRISLYSIYCFSSRSSNLGTITVDRNLGFKEEYGQIGILINQFLSPPIWIVTLRGDDGIYRVDIAFGQFEISYAMEMRIFSEEFQTYLQLIKPKDQVEVEHFITLLTAAITARRPLLQASPRERHHNTFLNQALAAYSRKFIKR